MGSTLIFDAELTDKKNGEIIEAAWLRIASGDDLLGPSPDLLDRRLQVAEAFHSRYRPLGAVTFGAMAVHHILPQELADAEPSSTFKLPEDCAYLIGHSIDFDYEAIGSPAGVKRIDTHAIAQHVWPNAGGYSQTALIYMLLGATETTRNLVRAAHSAARDVDLNRVLLLRILDQRPEIATWSQLWSFSEECRIPLTCPMKRYEGVPLADLDYGFIDWCLKQSWLDPYFRVGLEHVLDQRETDTRLVDADCDDDESDFDDGLDDGAASDDSGPIGDKESKSGPDVELPF